jgi:hypothetical protein
MRKQAQRRKISKLKGKKSKNDEGKYTNLCNELLDAGICGEWTSSKLGIQH